MFTNWLTSPSTATSTSVTQTSSTSASSFIGQLTPNIMATPPDIILEVGPPPSVRFVAHSSLLAMHSGYLRSAIRLDENNANIHNTIGGGGSGSSMELPPIYLTNVTPEQFGPLLTYMYTGYLDLTLENIFGVLLATHVLHMPRALEICRAFLARSQAEGFLNGNYLNQINNNNSNNNNNCELTATKNSKIIRPIPSKPIISNLGFIVPPMQHVSLPTTDTSFRSLNSQSLENLTKISQEISNKKITNQKNEESNSSNPSPIDNLNSLETKRKSSPISNSTTHSNQTLLPSVNNPTTVSKRSPKLKRSRSKSSSTTTDHSLSNSNTAVKFSTINQNIATTSSNIQNHCSNNNVNSSSQENENKVIIDVASCDGPVRFRRVLNDAYGRQPDSVHIPPPQHERSHQSVSYSFHQQMAKNISQQRHQQQQQQQQHQHQHEHHSEESENSEDVKNNTSNTNQHCSNGSNTSANSTGETFNCVYCKHTFKSQYCYQKHAKRHLNPLALEQGEGIILAPSATSFRDLFKDNKSIVPSGGAAASGNITTSTITNTSHNNSNKRETNTTTTAISSKLSGNTFNNSDLTVLESSGNNNNNTTTSLSTTSNNKREVRPLDMNVQYYPCKTCGSKFPSYYFVHKHRKMCHANEDN